MAGRPSTADAGRGSADLSPAEFERALREATASMPRHDLGPAAARIPDLRRALHGRIDKEGFDRGLLQLREAGTVALRPHAYPTSLDPSDVEDAFQEGHSLLFFLHWLK